MYLERRRIQPRARPPEQLLLLVSRHLLHPSLLPRTPPPPLVSIPPTQSLDASHDQPLAIVRFDKTKAYRAGEPGLLCPHFSRAANERPKARSLEPSSHRTFAAEAAVPGLIRIGPRLLDVLLDDLLSPAHHAAIVESLAIEQSQDARIDAHIRLHQLAVLVGLPQSPQLEQTSTLRSVGAEASSNPR